MKILFISGIPINHHGAGRYLGFIRKELAADEEITYLLPTISSKKFNQSSISHFFSNYPRLMRLLRNWMYTINNIILLLKCYVFTFTHQKVIIFHPQSIGIPLTDFLIRHFKHSYIFVLDNFFICKKSYNHFQNENVPCFRCLKLDNSVEFNCSPFPVKFKDYQYKSLMLAFSENLDKITLLFQNELQKKIYVERYPTIKYFEIVGMITNELDERIVDNPLQKFSYDFVYHGTLSSAKGCLIFFEIAEKFQNHSFFFPYSQENVKNTLGIKEYPENIVFKSIFWETGYKEIIATSKVVMCLSIWSAPIEGAFLKSIYFNGVVCCINTSYSFYNEIPNNIACKLEADSSCWETQVDKLLNDEIYRASLKTSSQEWLNDYKKNVQMRFSLLRNHFLDN